MYLSYRNAQITYNGQCVLQEKDCIDLCANPAIHSLLPAIMKPTKILLDPIWTSNIFKYATPGGPYIKLGGWNPEMVSMRSWDIWTAHYLTQWFSISISNLLSMKLVSCIIYCHLNIVLSMLYSLLWQKTIILGFSSEKTLYYWIVINNLIICVTSVLPLLWCQ